MEELQHEILENLQELKGSGNFASIRQDHFVFPGLEVMGLGELAYPITPLQAKALIGVAHKAHFGKGSQTILDTSVRSAWEVDAEDLKFNNAQWNVFLEKALENIQTDLGLEGYKVSANLYKLLIYEEGDFFLKHKDSEKEEGMFGTLIIGLPSKHTGGELVIQFEGREEVANFASSDSSYSLNYAAFFADCDHEVKPLTSGYRVCLVYNLIQKEAGPEIVLESTRTQVDKLAQLLEKVKDYQKPIFVLLGHQYTPENFSSTSLKLNDRYKANALLMAAKQAGLYGKLCLVTSYIRGVPVYHSYREWVDEMEDIIDQELYIEHWVEDEYPGLSYVRFGEQDLISSSPINEGEPLISESEDYYGNAGPELNHWYHYGAVMIWTPQANARILETESTQAQLNWIGYFAGTKTAKEEEVHAVRNIFRYGLKESYRDSKPINYDSLTDWVIHRDDREFFLDLEAQRLQFLYLKMSCGSLVRLFEYLKVEETAWFFSKINSEKNLQVLEKSMEVLREMPDRSSLKNLSEKLLSQLPMHFQQLSQTTSSLPTHNGLEALLKLAVTKDQQWAQEISSALTRTINATYIRDVLTPRLIFNQDHSVLAEKLLEFCMDFLAEGVSRQPQPPHNWSRPVPEGTGYKRQWKILRPFLESPTLVVFDYQEKKEERILMEDAIASAEIDLTPQTIKKGSPHTLRLTKNQDAYERELKVWKKDVNLWRQLREVLNRKSQE